MVTLNLNSPQIFVHFVVLVTGLIVHRTLLFIATVWWLW